MTVDKDGVDLKLKNLVEKIEKLTEERKTVSEYISDTFKEAKAVGFDVKILKKIIALRKLELDERLETEALIETYKEALGMISE